MTELATQTLHTVAREIGVSLNEGRVALEAHVEKPGTPELLERCRFELHQVQGVLRVLEIYGTLLERDPTNMVRDAAPVARTLLMPCSPFRSAGSR